MQECQIEQSNQLSYLVIISTHYAYLFTHSEAISLLQADVYAIL